MGLVQVFQVSKVIFRQKLGMVGDGMLRQCRLTLAARECRTRNSPNARVKAGEHEVFVQCTRDNKS